MPESLECLFHNDVASELSYAPRKALIPLTAAAMVGGLLLLHAILANMYYKLNALQLRMTAEMAVRVGAVYLPADPEAAVRVADHYAQLHGVAPDEIVFTGTAADRFALTIRLRRTLPWYVALFTTPPDNVITAVATAWRQRGSPRRRLRMTRLFLGVVARPIHPSDAKKLPDGVQLSKRLQWNQSRAAGGTG